MKPVVNIIRAGRISYSKGLHLQTHLANQKTTPELFRNYLVLQEHDPVYTIGIRTKNYSEEDEQRLRRLGADFYRTNRGGLITFHGPGQLVAYPIIHLQQFKPSMRWYVATLEQVIIDTCHTMGVVGATTTEETGIWVGNNKICAIGVHGSRYITTHGIGLNVCTDLNWFKHIIACGIKDKGVTTLSQELKRVVTIAEASEVFLKSFPKVFDCSIVEHNDRETYDLLKQAKKVA